MLYCRVQRVHFNFWGGSEKIVHGYRTVPLEHLLHSASATPQMMVPQLESELESAEHRATALPLQPAGHCAASQPLCR